MDTVSNALSKIKNANMAGQKEVELRKSKIVLGIVKILKDENFVDGYSDDDGKIVVNLGYLGKEPKITHFKKISNPGQKVYFSVSNLRPVLNGRGIGIISTSKGVMEIDSAKNSGVGGEYICQIW